MTLQKRYLAVYSVFSCLFSVSASAQVATNLILPDKNITEAYEKAASQNVLAAVNNKIFPGYFSVCADGLGFGYGNTYPSLDGHQMSDALLWLGQTEVVKGNWDYVRGFQKSKGELPIAIIPAEAGKMIGPKGFQAPVDPNGGLYKHWVPKDPLKPLAGPTYIQNADVIFRFTQDKQWLISQLPSINLTADYLASMVNAQGDVGGAGYYVERPTRVEFDGVSQGHAADAFYRLAALNTIAGDKKSAEKYTALANKIKSNFQNRFWMKDHFAEYYNPERGFISNHGYTDVDWTSIATHMATREQQIILWPNLISQPSFYYNGMPTGISTKPETYEAWETTYADNQDLAAMGRVWYIEAWARANMNDGKGLVESIQRVCKEGRDSGYYWRERYNAKGGYGAKKYNEYPANLIRITQRFLFGVEFGLDGSIELSPTAPADFWTAGFGQTIDWRGIQFTYLMKDKSISGEYQSEKDQVVKVRIKEKMDPAKAKVLINGKSLKSKADGEWLVFILPKSSDKIPLVVSF
ncbi:hypothetical protein [Pollutibacter soli]|uniref:hypothetical protein n=1 Tax=Pollutibacter soli TaxID=3034157 RepID=UPI0030137070